MFNPLFLPVFRNNRMNRTYILSDNYSVALSAGSVNNTDSDSGLGKRTVIDTNNKLSISGGKLLLATGGVNFSDPGIFYPSFPRIRGRVIISDFSVGAGTVQFGFNNINNISTTPNIDAIRSNGGTTLQVRVNGVSSIAVGTIALNTAYQLAVVVRDTGSFFFIKGGVFTNWSLIWQSTLSTNSDLYPAIGGGTTGVGEFSRILVPVALWTPSPLVSDGFTTTWGTSDGKGHSEGLSGTLGNGGNGKIWTSNVGSWTVASGSANTSALVSGRSIATIDAGKADFIISANMDVPTTTQSLIVRWVDENNNILLRRTPTNLQLVKTVAGVPTTVSDNASTHVSNAEVRLICEGSKFRMFYNGSAVSTEQTISDSVLQSSTVVGIRSGAITCTIDNFVVYARGTTNEYSYLDTY